VRPYILRRLGAEEIASRAAELTSLYVQVYSEPPYHESEDDADDFMSRLLDLSTTAGFAFIAAEVPTGHDRIIGFAYGIAFAPDRWWRSAGEEPELTKGAAKFAVMEFVVRPTWRGKGVGRELMHELLSARTEPFATLFANPAAPARAIYGSWGWQQVAVAQPPRMPPMDVLVRPLGES
jgi:GNAT superfamily N-acetyltransferase